MGVAKREIKMVITGCWSVLSRYKVSIKKSINSESGRGEENAGIIS